jgi:hypothetical protein
MAETWTKKLPTEQGWYWWRESISFNGKVVYVTETDSAYLPGDELRHYLTWLGGEWYGPLQEPGGDVNENCLEETFSMGEPWTDADTLALRDLACWAKVTRFPDQALLGSRAADELERRGQEIEIWKGRAEAEKFWAEKRDDELAVVTAERDRFQAFKTWVHAWLDSVGVPSDPDPEKTKVTGCRIGGRLAYLRNTNQ